MRNLLYITTLILSLSGQHNLFGQCNISLSPTNPCAATPVTLSVTNPTSTYGWDIDNDGFVDLYGNSITHSFPESFIDLNYTIVIYENGSVCSTEDILVLGMPDASIGVIPGSGILEEDLISVCSASPQITLEIYNASTTFANNQSYEIDWGDGSIETFDNNSFSNTTTITHDYFIYGYYSISITTTSTNGCTSTKDYTLYNGSNPSVGLANPGNTVGLCVPTTIDFPITNTSSNPTGTIYTIYVSGEVVALYNQENIPNIFSYTFLETSCGESTSTGNYQNAFDVQILASNPCGSSQATIEPIELSEPPELEFESDEPSIGCEEDIYTFTNTSGGLGEVIAGNCTSLAPSWTITPGIPGIHYEIISGNTFASDEIEIVFLIPGDYTVTMTINSPSCGENSFSQSFEIIEASEAGGSGSLVAASAPALSDECVPSTGVFTNLSTGDSLEHEWDISPNQGWQYISPYNENSTDLQVLFTEAGSYDISLNSSNLCSSDSWDTTLVVVDAPEIEIAPIPNSCETVTLNFDPNSVLIDANFGTLSSIEWSFPGGTPSSSTETYPINIYYDSPGSYAIEVTVTNQCGTATANQTLIIESIGTIQVSDDVVICENGDPFFVSGIPTGGTWSGNGVSSNGSFEPSNEIIGENVLTYIFQVGSCNLQDSLTVTVTPIPEIGLPNEQLLCLNEPAYNLGAATPLGGLWTGSGIIGNNFDPLLAGPGIHSITYTYIDPQSGCSNSATMEMEVVPLPEVTANDTSFCITPGLVDLPFASPPGGDWSGPGVIGTQFDPETAGGTGSYTVEYSYTNQNNCTQTESIIITVIEPENVNAGLDFEICIDADEIDLSQVASPANGVWNANGSLGLNGAVFDPTLAGVGTHLLTYTIGEGNCQVSDDIEIVVNPLPVVNTMDDFEVCASESNVPLDGNPAGGTWTANNGGVLVGNIFNPAQSGVGVFSFTYTYVNANNCAQSSNLLITVLQLPEIITNDTTLCNTPGAVAIPNAQPGGGSWTGPGVINGTFDPQIAGGVGTYIITYSFEDSNACLNTETATITIVPTADVDAGIDETICIDQGLLELSDFTPANGQWSGPGIIDAENGILDPTLAGAGSHLLTYTVGLGNCQVNDVKIIEIIDLEIEAGPDMSSCYSYDAFYLDDYTPEGGWWSGEGIVDANTGLFDPAVADDGTHVLTYHFTDPESGCEREDSRTIIVYPMEPANFDMPNFACRNEVIEFENLSPEGYDVYWIFGQGGGSSSEFNPTYVYDVVGTFTVILVVENQHGCKDTTSQEITIADVPVAIFELAVSETCIDVGLTFNNQSFGDSLSYFWEFGDFQTSTEENPGTIFFEPSDYDTTYIITLTVTNICGTSTYQDVILVHPIPNADFGLVPLTECSPLFVDFANASTGTALEYYWVFGNGNTSDEQFPETETYFTDTVSTIYNVQLIATNLCGSDTATTELLVESANVIAAGAPSITEGCTPLTVDFYNYSTPTATIDWEFGDGNTSAQPQPTHTFATAGEYTVIQYANSDCGYDTSTIIITVFPSPEVNFEHDEVVCSGQVVNFINNSVNASGNHWDFGDGDTFTLNNPTHIYTNPGTYTITLTGTSMFNQCVAVYSSTITVLDLPVSEFEPSTTYGCAPLEVTFTNNSNGALFYEWNFGDGNGSIDTEPTHTFEEAGTYEVSLLASDANGCFESYSVFNIIVTPQPEAAFDFVREAACGLPATIHFENLSEGAIEYEWFFEEGITSDLTNTTYTYATAGTHAVQLVATNQFACTDTFDLNFEVYESPTAGIEIESMEGCEPLEVQFNNSSLGSSEYLWDFGDGSTSTEASPNHVYTSVGEYQIQLIASIADACADTLDFDELIRVNPQAIANFEAIEQGGDGTYQLVNLSEKADTYFWEFSDGATSTEENPVHRFNTNGVHQLYLEASNEYGCVDDTLVSFVPDFVRGLYLPNAFSPEQGIGDVRVFKAKGVGLKEYRLQVFSTYGQLLWETTELDESGRPTEGWDGMMDGELMPQDVYVWKCSGIFEDGGVWRGVEKDGGGYKVIGSLVLLR